MKVVILAGGLGTRLSEETTVRPKPMVEIGGRPILWHIMKGYASAGFDEFVICCGYKGYVIKEYFANYRVHQADVTFHLGSGNVQVHHLDAEPWTVTLVETGAATQTGGRILRVADYLDDDEFAVTYGDAVSDVDVARVVDFHHAQGRLATVTAVRPPARFGALELDGSAVREYREKPADGEAWINGGFFVCSREVLSYIDGDDTLFEREPLERLAKDGKLSAYRHDGFWHPMDTLRDRITLEQRWASGDAPWRRW